ncbi:branched-chain amino acid transport system II carrier protein [Metaclostridioides mangenotii]|uniref:branched-chain amino acid transport system II carrier protein n=1 Tax=Metaclostridioides mangenotii TaxID=1540 RepID=UPI00047FAA83|nr:branched-chain amino acid transport system II carrier protein [Clostridioides mangenotii]
MSKQMKDIIIVGFALFSMFFGAGNLLFPPYLGLVSGQNWLLSIFAFVLADAGIALLVIIASAKCSGSLDDILSRSGKTLARIISIAALSCLALLVIPRTAATTYEMGIMPIIGDFGSLSRIICSMIFFALTLVLTIKGSKVIDIIGKFLTPALLLILFILIIKGIISPIADPNPAQLIDRNLFAAGFTQGYQTMDALGAASMATIMLLSLAHKGYTDEKQKISMTIKSGVVACVFLGLVYGGLAFLGSTVSTMFGTDVPQASLLVEITNLLYGYTGKAILGLIVALACLTTAIGLTSAIANYFAGITKIKYEQYVIGICVASTVIANLGVDFIITFSVPILQLVYPVLLVLVLMTLAGAHIKNDNAFKGAAYATLATSMFNILYSLTGTCGFINQIPLTDLGFNWIIPAVIFGLIGSFINRGSDNHSQNAES